MRRRRTGQRAAVRSEAQSPHDWSAKDPEFAREQARYADPIPSRELIAQHLKDAGEPLTAKRLAKRLGLTRAAQREALDKRLAAMLRDGQASVIGEAFAVAEAGATLTGRVRGRANGEAVVIADDGSPPLAMLRADLSSLMHQDRVEVRVGGVNERGRRIARLLRRLPGDTRRIAGVWRSVHQRGVVEPEDPGHWYRIEGEPRKGLQLHEGDYVLADITRRPSGDIPAQVKIVDVLRNLRPADLAVEFAVLRHELPKEFPGEVRRAAERLGTEVRDADCADREDLRALPLVTIDGEDARDFDDAVYAEPARGGGWRLLVAIADVSHYVHHGSAIDDEARGRATSVYFPDRVIPMLPEQLSNQLCSLMPAVDRLAFVCDMSVSKMGKVSRARFYEATIHSHARLTYDTAWTYLEGSKSVASQLAKPVRDSLDALYAVYGVLKGSRDARGALDFRGGEVKARIGPDGIISGFYAPARNDAHKLIEECMIAANVEAAAALRAAKAGGLYRVHGLPESKRVTELGRIMHALNIGVMFSEEPTPREYRQLIERLGGHEHGALLEGLVIRSLAQAVYQPTNIGHFGLALEEYAHFTSPIRRYPDLIVHRALKAARLPHSGSGHRYGVGELEALGIECSQRERRADDASRDVLGYLECLYMQPRVGEEFEAKITAATEFGLFVQLAEMPVDGLVHVSGIGGDYWELDKSGLGLVGRATRRRWQLGQAVRVTLTRVDVPTRQIDFELVNRHAGPGRKQTAARRGRKGRDQRG
jgi:ribonuclease R